MLSRILRLLSERRIIKVADTPPSDETIDEYSHPFGDMPLVAHLNEDFSGFIHEEGR